MANMEQNECNCSLIYRLAANEFEIRKAQRLRYEVFGEEMQARLCTAEYGIDFDFYDSYCHHLVVIDKNNQDIVGYTRILTNEQAATAGGFYSQNEFDLDKLLPLPGPTIEVGRTCIHPAYRKSRALTTLWVGLTKFMQSRGIQYLMGCASIPMPDGPCDNNFLVKKFGLAPHLSPENQVIPRHPLPSPDYNNNANTRSITLPSLMKAYLRLGAKICGPPCWDEDFRVADVFILVEHHNIARRYQRYFLERNTKEGNSPRFSI